MKKEEKKSVGRPRLADEATKKRALLIILITLIVTIVFITLGISIVSKSINPNKIKGASVAMSSNVQTYSLVNETKDQKPNICHISLAGLSKNKVKYQVRCQANARPISIRIRSNGKEYIMLNGFDHHNGFFYTGTYNVPGGVSKDARLVLKYKNDSETLIQRTYRVYKNGKLNAGPIVPARNSKKVPSNKCYIGVSNIKYNSFNWILKCDSGAKPKSIRLTTTKGGISGAEVDIVKNGFDNDYGIKTRGVYKTSVSPKTNYTLVLYFASGKYGYYKTTIDFKTLARPTTTSITTGKLVYPLPKGVGKWSDGTKYSKDHLHYSSGKWHGGNDISVKTGTSVYAMDGGTVVMGDITRNKKCESYGFCGGGYSHFGKFILLKHKKNNKIFYTAYAHLSKVLVSVGDTVKQGQKIGETGNTGNSSGPHLHIGMSYGKYDNNGYPIYNKNVISAYDYISGSKKGKSYIKDKGKNY